MTCRPDVRLVTGDDGFPRFAFKQEPPVAVRCPDPIVPQFVSGQIVTARELNRLVDAANQSTRVAESKYARFGAAVSTPSGVMGIPVELYTPIFAASRITGWAAHILEQHDNNRLIRPGCRYTGSPVRKFVEMDKRK